MSQSGKVYLANHIVEVLQSRLAQVKTNGVGYLFGVRNDHETSIHGYHIINGDLIAETLAANFEEALELLPGGIQPCGLIVKVANLMKSMKPLCTNLLSSSSVLQTHFGASPILVLGVDSISATYQAYWLDLESKDLREVSWLPLDDEHSLQKTHVLFRLRGNVEFEFEHHDQQASRLKSVLNEMRCLENRFRSKSTVYRVVNSPEQLFLHFEVASDTNNHEIDQSNSSFCVSELLKSVLGGQTESGGSKSKKNAADEPNFVQPPIDIRMSSRSTGLGTKEGFITCSPIIHHEHKQFRYATVQLPFDVLVYAPHSLSVNDLPSLFVDGSLRQLKSMINCLVKYSQDTSYVVPKPFHIVLSQLSYIVTVVFPEGFPDDKLESVRKALHDRFLVACDRPTFRRTNAILFGSNVSNGGYLLNVHNGLAWSGVIDGKSFIVQGRYAYHHYMQDRIDDSGWGCAYRSLQTIISWFRLQGYSDKPVPTHAEIQQALVSIGDKPAAFVGSRQWIGSMEVSFVLDKLIEVSCKILHVTSGAEMASKARELAKHFETQGTPIMIGGGVLAHTILGVDWNEGTGDVKFLILDPHYTGAEELKFIQDKGWCGWKSPGFWDPSAYYNLCLPQRPTVF